MTDLKTVVMVSSLEAEAHVGASALLFEDCKFEQCNDALEDSMRALEKGRAALLTLEALNG